MSTNFLYSFTILRCGLDSVVNTAMSERKTQNLSEYTRMEGCLKINEQALNIRTTEHIWSQLEGEDNVKSRNYWQTKHDYDRVWTWAKFGSLKE